MLVKSTRFYPYFECLPCYTILNYRKLQKLCWGKVLRFIGFYHNVGKAFVVLLLISMKTTF